MYTDVELMKVLESVEKEFNTHLAKAEEELKTASLAKSEDKPFPPKDEKKPEEKEEGKEEKKPEGEPKPEGKEEPQAAEGEQKPAEAQGEAQPEGQPQPEGQAQPQPQGDESHGYDDEDMEHMNKMYMSMSKAELKAHHDSCRMALDSQGMQKCGDMGMAKSEELTSFEVKVPQLEAETALLKSELSAEKVKTAELQKKVDLAAEFMGKLAAKKSAPQGKAITSLEVISKSESTNTEEKTFTKEEVTSILNKKIVDSTLTKSDREAINNYYLGSKDIKIVRHLLT